MKKIIGCTVSFSSCLLPVFGRGDTPKYEAFYVFGDSLSDTGNDHILTKLQKIDPADPSFGKSSQDLSTGVGSRTARWRLSISGANWVQCCACPFSVQLQYRINRWNIILHSAAQHRGI